MTVVSGPTDSTVCLSTNTRDMNQVEYSDSANLLAARAWEMTEAPSEPMRFSSSDSAVMLETPHTHHTHTHTHAQTQTQTDR